MYFLTVAKFEKVLENGSQRKVSEQYLVDAMSCTEAEARTLEELKPFVSGELEVTSTKQMAYSEIFFNENGDRYWECKIDFITLDETSGVEKKTRCKMLVQASNIKEAMDNLNEGMKGTLDDYWIAGINETKIMDVYTVDLEFKEKPKEDGFNLGEGEK